MQSYFAQFSQLHLHTYVHTTDFLEDWHFQRAAAPKQHKRKWTRVFCFNLHFSTYLQLFYIILFFITHIQLNIFILATLFGMTPNKRRLGDLLQAYAGHNKHIVLQMPHIETSTSVSQAANGNCLCLSFVQIIS